MAGLAAGAPDKDVVLANLETVLAWDLNGSPLPRVSEALAVIEQFTSYGRIVAADLHARCLDVPADSDAARTAQAVLGEASRRFNLSPPYYGTARAVGQRAQNAARLVQALLRAVDRIGEAQAHSADNNSTS
ncbi:DUF6415 family natural product biosynthesis protein [Streptomyces sp. NPDC014748]|uniref:DUF6415 family natural product biosynthesis protein n=1 Tax=Streptomyces sp. NPDC014748 TaxID=3364905 RepID=UPI0036FC684B